MKTTIKIFVAVSAFMACTLPAMTQDTIHSHALPEHLWYYGGWPDSILTDTTSGVIVYLGPFVVARYYGIIKHTDSALTIYGIAAAFMYESDPGVVYRVQHPAMSDLNDEHLQLWEINDNSIWQVGHDILIPVSNTIGTSVCIRQIIRTSRRQCMRVTSMSRLLWRAISWLV